MLRIDISGVYTSKNIFRSHFILVQRLDSLSWAKVFGRKHTDIQTDSYLEELTERVVEFESETQTDFPYVCSHSKLELFFSNFYLFLTYRKQFSENFEFKNILFEI